MNKLLLLCVLATLANAIPTGNRELQKRDITPDKFKTVVRGILAYKQYVPSDLVEELEQLMEKDNAGETAEMFNFISKVQAMNPTPEFPEIGRLLKKDSPKIFTRVARLFTSTILRIISLSQPAQQFFTDSKSDSKTNADRVRNIAAMKKRFDKLPSNVQAEFYVQFPEIMKFFATPAYQTFIKSMVELSEQSDEVIEAAGILAIRRFVADLMTMDH